MTSTFMTTFLFALALTSSYAHWTASKYTLFGYSDVIQSHTDGTWAATGGSLVVSVDTTNNASAAVLLFELETAIAGDSTFNGHIHDADCASGGGSHWQADSTGPVDETNEFFFSFVGEATTDQTLWYLDVTNENFVLDSGAVSVVVHDSNGDRQLCIDITQVTDEEPYTLIASNHIDHAMTDLSSGTYTTWGHFSVWSQTDLAENGTTIGVLGFQVSPSIGGYMSHIHEDTCENGGGDHWKYDPDSSDSTTANEFMVSDTPDDLSTGWGKVVINDNFAIYKGDETAMSIVLHLSSDSSLIACSDLDLAASFHAHSSDPEDSSASVMSAAFALSFAALVALK